MSLRWHSLAFTEWLEARGYRVIRFNNREVLANLEGVLEAIREACGVNPTSPSPP